MDLYNFYISTSRYVMSATADDKTSWSEIFKYLSTLRQMVGCCVCGNLAFRPQSPDHKVCLHLVCEACVGGKMRLRPSCSWCKDKEVFIPNKSARVLINCFKRLCLYISSSEIGQHLYDSARNGNGSEVEKVLTILEEAGNFDDEIVLTPAPCKVPKISKLVSQKLASYPSGSQTGASTSSEKRDSGKSYAASKPRGPNGKGRRVSIMSTSLKSNQTRSSVAQHVKRLKKKAMNTHVKKPSPKLNLSLKRQRPGNSSVMTSSFLISNRPHRDRSGKCSIGQLWRETFLEEEHRDVVYPDSGIEVETSSDQDQASNSQVSPALSNPVKPGVIPSSNLMTRFKETRSHGPANIGLGKDQTTLENIVTSSTDSPGSSRSVTAHNKPRLTLKISKKVVVSHPYSRRAMRSPSGRDEATTLPSNSLLTTIASKNLSTKRVRGVGGRFTHQSIKMQKKATEICKCARFKPPSQLTCFGQKCPCYSERRACMDCLCNGCKNPLQVSTDSAPQLMRFTKDGIEVSTHNRCMPRLSPIPKA